MGQIQTPSIQPSTAPLGFWETTVGRSVRRAAILGGTAALTSVFGSLVQDQSLQQAAGGGDKVAFALYWIARTLLDLLNPKVTNL